MGTEEALLMLKASNVSKTEQEETVQRIITCVINVLDGIVAKKLIHWKNRKMLEKQ